MSTVFMKEHCRGWWTLWRRREDILAYFDLGASNGPVEGV